LNDVTISGTGGRKIVCVILWPGVYTYHFTLIPSGNTEFIADVSENDAEPCAK